MRPGQRGRSGIGRAAGSPCTSRPRDQYRARTELAVRSTAWRYSGELLACCHTDKLGAPPANARVRSVVAEQQNTSHGHPARSAVSAYLLSKPASPLTVGSNE